MLLWAWIILALLFLGMRVVRALTSDQIMESRDRFDSLEILKMRCAKGEIGQEDYLTMKESLKQSGEHCCRRGRKEDPIKSQAAGNQ